MVNLFTFYKKKMSPAETQNVTFSLLLGMGHDYILESSLSQA